MDRVISLLAALVGLIALGGAILVHTNVDVERQQMAAELAQMKAQIGLAPAPAAPATPAPAATSKPADDGMAEALLALQNRIAALEQVTSNQAVELQAARAALSAASSAQPPVQVAAAEPSASASGDASAASSALAPPALTPPAASAPAAVVADGPTKDCIPLGTRFMASSGDSFPICKTHAVVKVASVSDGSAIIEGAGPVSAGGFGNLDTKGCTVMVFSADTSGYAEMRVTCQ